MDATCLLWGKRGVAGNLFYNVFNILERSTEYVWKDRVNFLMDAAAFKELFDKTPLEGINHIEVRLFNALRRKHINTLGGALRVVELGSENAFISRNFGQKTLANLVYTLKDGGFLIYGSRHDLHIPSVAERLKWLAEQIQNHGSPTRHIDFMIAAALSFIRQGHTSTQGEYASVVAQAVRWLEVDRPLTDETMLYGLLCVLGENYGMEVSPASFEAPAVDNLTTLEQVHRYAILIGNVPICPWEFKVYEDRPFIWHSHHASDLAWMTVGAPRPITR